MGRGSSKASGRGASSSGGGKGNFSEEQIKDAIQKFTSDKYKQIRQAMNGEKVTHTKLDLETKQRKEIDDTQKYKDMGKAIEQYISDSPSYQSPLYRGVAVSDETLKSFKEGAVINQKGLSSWTTDENAAKNFGTTNSQTPNKVVFVESKGTKRGRSVGNLTTASKTENEVIQSSKNKQKIESVETKGGTTYVYVKEI